jgi:hypothetical protein
LLGHFILASVASSTVAAVRYPEAAALQSSGASRLTRIVPHRYGVGGEYPMAAGSAAERAETGGIQKARFRGREVVLTFSMQVRHPTLLTVRTRARLRAGLRKLIVRCFACNL